MIFRSKFFNLFSWENESLSVPLSQLKPIDETAMKIKEAVEDWHYWVQMGYQFG